MRKLLLGATAFATLALFSGVASAQVADPGLRHTGGAALTRHPQRRLGFVPVEANAIAAFGAGVGTGFGFGINGSFGKANGYTGSATFTQGVGNGSYAKR